MRKPEHVAAVPPLAAFHEHQFGTGESGPAWSKLRRMLPVKIRARILEERQRASVSATQKRVDARRHQAARRGGGQF